jgi:hypothetical protein
MIIPGASPGYGRARLWERRINAKGRKRNGLVGDH